MAETGKVAASTEGLGSLGRFALQSVLGQGGMGVVYRAYDPELGCEVAVKTLNTLSAYQIRSIKQEFRALADLDNENIVKMWELFVADGRAFYSMELLPSACDFGRWCTVPYAVDPDADTVPQANGDATRPERPAAETPTPERRSPAVVVGPTFAERVRLDRLTRALGQLRLALDGLHAAGYTHCDIKPSNALITPDGRLRLVDFGLVTRTDTGHSAADIGAVSGTPAFMAPEQLASAPVSAATDWYSVGAMLFFVATGALPFDSPADRLSGTRHLRAPPVRMRARDVPEGLALLIDQLLEPDPLVRAGSREVRAWLTQQSHSAGAAQPTPADGGIPDRSARSPVWMAGASAFFGREHELEDLRTAHALALRAERSVVRITGASGIGKSTLVETWLRELRSSANSLVLTGRCHPMASMPFRGLDEFLDNLSRILASAHYASCAEALAPGQIAALRRLFPILGRVIREPHGAPIISSAPELRRRGVEGMEALLAAISTVTPLVIWLDDVQWSDLDSLRVLESLWTAPTPQRVLWVVSHRNEPPTPESALEVLDESLRQIAGHVTSLTIAPLPQATARDLLIALLRESDAFDATPTQIDEWVAEAGGVPFLLRMAAASVADGMSMGGTPLTEYMVLRYLTMPPASQRALEAISLAGYPLEAAALPELIDDLGSWRVAADPLRRALLVRFHTASGAPELLPFHDRIAESVAASMASADRLRLHRRLAEYCIAHNRPAERVLLHLESCGEAPRAATFAVLAAEEATAALAFERAAQLWQKAIDLGAREHALWQLRARRAEVLVWARLGTEGGREYARAADELANLTGDPGQVATLRRQAFGELLRAGRLEEGRGILADVLHEVALPPLAGPKRTLFRIAVEMLRLRLRGLHTELRPTEATHGKTRLQLEVAWEATTGLSYLNVIQSHAIALRHLRLALDVGEASHVARALAYEATFLSVLGWPKRHAEAAKMLELSAKMIGTNLQPYASAWQRLGRCGTAYFATQWHVAAESGAWAGSVFRDECRGAAWEMLSALSFAVSGLAHAGRFAALRRMLQPLLDDADRRHDVWASTGLRMGMPALIRLADDEPEALLTQAEAAFTWWREREVDSNIYLYIIATTYADLYAGTPERALERFRANRKVLTSASWFRLEMCGSELYYLHARILLAVMRSQRGALASSQQIREWQRELERCQTQVALSSLPGIRAWSAGLAAEVACATGDAQAALAALDAAQARYQEAGMQLHAASARYFAAQWRHATDDEALGLLAAEGVKVPERFCMSLFGDCRPLPTAAPA